MKSKKLTLLLALAIAAQTVMTPLSSMSVYAASEDTVITAEADDSALGVTESGEGIISSGAEIVIPCLFVIICTKSAASTRLWSTLDSADTYSTIGWPTEVVSRMVMMHHRAVLGSPSQLMFLLMSPREVHR